MRFNNNPEYINFYNNTEFPVSIESWVNGSIVMKSIVVNPQERHIINSNVCEWHLWGWTIPSIRSPYIGKFRSEACASGNYSWLEYEDDFECVYSEHPDNKIKGLITLTVKNKNNKLLL